MIGVPVIINHQDISKENADEIRRGVVSDVWYNPEINWFECAGVIWDETAQNLITDKGWSVSCSYDVKLADDTGGTENNIPYDIEFLDGVFTHLAIVDNPRYERANIVFNSKTIVQNFDPNQKRDRKGRWTKDDAAIQKKKECLTPVEVNPDDVPKFKTKEELGEWFSEIFKDLGSVTIEDTGTKIDLYKSNAEREASKRRLQKEENKAVAKAFEEIVSKSIKVDERTKDERHKHDQDVYYNKLKLGKDTYAVSLYVDYLEPNKEYRYAGHSATIDNKISTRDLQISKIIIHTKVDNNIITDIREDFNPMIKNNEVQNWNEADHPRDEAGKFTDKKSGLREKIKENEIRTKESEKRISREYTQLHVKEYQKAVDDDPKSEGIFTNDDGTWLLTEVWGKGKDKDGWDLVKGGKVIKHFNDRYEAYDAWDKGYFSDIDSMDKQTVQNNKEQDMAIIDELKKLITKVENDKGENMDENKEKVENEKVDKRKLIDEVAGIMKSAGADDEKIRTAIAKMEKLAYDKSEAGTADNEKEDDPKSEKDTADNKKVKNEETKEDEKKYDDLKKDVKEDVENKCKNSVDNAKGGYFDKMNEIYNAATQPSEENTYISREQKLKYAEEYFAK